MTAEFSSVDTDVGRLITRRFMVEADKRPDVGRISSTPSTEALPNADGTPRTATVELCAIVSPEIYCHPVFFNT